MEILIAILWYLHLLVPGTTYTIDQVNAIATQNHPIVQSVQTNPVMMNQAVNKFQQDMNNDYKKIIEEWEDDPQPILQ